LRFALLFALISSALSAEVTSWRRQGATFRLELTDGTAEIGWLSQSSFRFSRCWSANCIHTRIYDDDDTQVTLTERDGWLEFETAYVHARFSKKDLAVETSRADGRPLLRQTGPTADGSVHARRDIVDKERFYGLAAFDGSLNLRGRTIQTARPLLISSAGYGEFHGLAGDYTFNLATGETTRLNANQWEQFVYYGPGPKEILSEHHVVAPGVPLPKRADVYGRPDNATDVPSLAALSQASLSGILFPLVDGKAGWSKWLSGSEWEPYLLTYLYEARERGLPVIHPLPIQFPEDEQAGNIADTLLIGDEFLTGTGAQVYLPRGIWTNWQTNQIHPGRQQAPAGMYVHNGTIVPIQKPSEMELHYFPRLGAEFFLSEPEAETISQFHAAPAGPYMRLQIESQLKRDYVWVLHHVGPPAKPEKTWKYDKKRRELRIPIHSEAKADIITRFALKQPLE
jgi:Glycosyl hydrolases family 31